VGGRPSGQVRSPRGARAGPAAATAIISARRVRFPQRVCRTREEAVAFVVSRGHGTACALPLVVARALEHVRTDATVRASR
jgi:hypothetical protein